MTMLDFMQDCAQQRPSQILNGQCAASSLQFSPCTIRISTAWSFGGKKNPVTPSHHWQATAEYHMSVAAEEVGKLLQEGNTYPWSRAEECCWQDGDYIEKLFYNWFYVLLTVHPCIILQIKPNWCIIFLSMFISFLYMFQATMCPQTGGTTVFMQHLVLVILYGWLSGMHDVHIVAQNM
jgi:hypothetical protein